MTLAGLIQNEYTQWPEINKHAHEGNWVATKRFLNHPPDAINAKTTPFGGTALHVKTSARNAEVVEKIAVLMSPKDLEIEDNCGCTAMEVIAKMAKCTIRENEGNG
jgi:hypothetical protein